MPPAVPPAETIIDRLEAATASTPEKIAITFLAEGSGVPQFLPYGELWGRAHWLARRLADIAAKGDRVVILMPSGIDVAIALYGCFIAGLVAVPTPAPHPSRVPAQSDLLLNVIRDCDPRIVLTTEALRDHEGFPKLSWEFMVPVWMTVDGGSLVDCGSMLLDRPARGDLAVLQYTSG